MHEFPLPWRVAVNPFGTSDDGVDNIFIVTSDGYCVAIINKHPVWNHMEKKRLELAQSIVDTMNKTET